MCQHVSPTGDLTSRLSTDTRLMALAVALDVNVLLRTFIKTLGMLSLMVSLSWKLTILMLLETPITGLLQNIYDTFYQVDVKPLKPTGVTLVLKLSHSMGREYRYFKIYTFYS